MEDDALSDNIRLLGRGAVAVYNRYIHWVFRPPDLFY